MPTPAQPARPAPPDLSKIPTVKAIEIQFQTNDDDKDSDTQLTVSFMHNDIVFAGTPREGSDAGGWMGVQNFSFLSNEATPWVSVPIHAPMQKDVIPQCTTKVRIDPNGNDTWRFNYWVRLHYTDGTRQELHFDGHALSEKVRENIFPLK